MVLQGGQEQQVGAGIDSGWSDWTGLHAGVDPPRRLVDVGQTQRELLRERPRLESMKRARPAGLISDGVRDRRPSREGLTDHPQAQHDGREAQEHPWRHSAWEWPWTIWHWPALGGRRAL